MSPTAALVIVSILAAGQARTPPRDTKARPPAPRPAGTARLSGMVVLEGQTPSPVRRALVTITAAELSVPLGAVTDDEVRFTVGDLPAGRFIVTAERKPFLTSSYGATRSEDAGTPIAVAAGQHAPDLRIVLARGAVLSGSIVDMTGEPLPGIRVSVIHAGPAPSPAGSAVTDDRGTYRVFGLPPGSYTISAAPPARSWSGQSAVVREREVDAALRDLRQRGSGRSSGAAAAGGLVGPPGDPSEQPRTFGYATTFYPGTPLADGAMSITVASGVERTGLDFVMSVVPKGQP
jgi:hypothetical protein